MSSAPPDKVATTMAAIGWLEMGSKRDAIDYVRGYASRHMNSAQSSWYAVAPLLGGWLWEVQEGAVGKSHIPDIIKALTAGVETSWFRVGRRAYTVSMRDGRPYPVLLPLKESRDILASGENRLNATGKMERVVKNGMGVFAFGLAVFLGGGIFLGAAAGYYALSQRYVPMDRQVAAGTLPHNQWAKVQNVPPNLFVETLRLSAGSTEWQAVIKPIQQAPAQAPTADSHQPEAPAVDAFVTEVAPEDVFSDPAQQDALKTVEPIAEIPPVADAPTSDGVQSDIPASPVAPTVQE